MRQHVSIMVENTNVFDILFIKILQTLVGFITVLAIYLTVGLDDPRESLPIQSIVWIFCEVKLSIDCSTTKLSLG